MAACGDHFSCNSHNLTTDMCSNIRHIDVHCGIASRFTVPSQRCHSTGLFALISEINLVCYDACFYDTLRLFANVDKFYKICQDDFPAVLSGTKFIKIDAGSLTGFIFKFVSIS